MGILAWLLFGLIAGALAQLLIPGEDPGGRGISGILITIVIGIGGAMIGGFIGSALGFGGVTGFDVASFLIAILGAVVLLVVWRSVSRGTHARI
jgi:uncharacterized membrane protein YeaQ/YmgE (transglycosylase-associated protein family)